MGSGRGRGQDGGSGVRACGVRDSGEGGPHCPVMCVNVLLHINVQRFRGGLVFKAHRLLYHSTLGFRVLEKKKKSFFLFA